MTSPKDFLVVGLVRNNEQGIHKTVDQLRKVFSPIGNVRFLLVESDSDDNTVGRLNELKQASNDFDFASLGKLNLKFPKRTERLAHCRNHYLNEIKINPRYSSVDYIAVVDLDGVTDLLSSTAIQTCFESDKPWSVCTANQKGQYYDIWALRHPLWNPTDCWQQYEFLEKRTTRSVALYATIYSKMIRIKMTDPWLEVDSAFGGFALYKKEAFLCGEAYIGLDELGKLQCEHVPFHKKIREQGHRIYINPKLVNTGSTTEHTRTLTHFVFEAFLREAKQVFRLILKQFGRDIVRNHLGKYTLRKIDAEGIVREH